MKKRLFCAFLIVMLAVTFCVSGRDGGLVPSAYAVPGDGETVDSLKGNLDDIEGQQDEVEEQLDQTVADIKAIQQKVDSLEAKISDTTKQIKETEKQIADKEAEIEERESNLNQRLRIMYKNGSVGFFDVLLGSKSISEFVSNLEMIKKIYESDTRILKILQEEHEALKEIKAELDGKKQQLADQKAELANEKAALDKKKKQLEEKEDELKAEADRLTYEIVALMDAQSEYIGGVFSWPCPSSHYISSPFGTRLHPVLKVWKTHTGIDIAAGSGNQILAAAPGRVIKSAVYSGYGNCVMIDHGGGIVSLYGHASQLLVGEGDIVARGQVIALVGSTGISTGPHLHFEVRENGQYVDPMGYLGG